MLQAEVGSVKANPDRDDEGIVVEAYFGKGLGTVATALVKRGTNRVGDVFVVGETQGRVPSTQVSLVGFEGVPAAGDMIFVAPDE